MGFRSKHCVVTSDNYALVSHCISRGFHKPDTIKGKKSQIQTTLGKLFLSQRYVVLPTLLFMPRAAWTIAKLSDNFIVRTLGPLGEPKPFRVIKHTLLWNSIVWFPWNTVGHKNHKYFVRICLTHNIWESQPSFTRPKWNMGEMEEFQKYFF